MKNFKVKVGLEGEEREMGGWGETSGGSCALTLKKCWCVVNWKMWKMVMIDYRDDISSLYFRCIRASHSLTEEIQKKKHRESKR